MTEQMERMTISKKLIELVETRRFTELRKILVDLEPADVAEMIEGLGRENEAVVFRVLPRDMATSIFEYFSLETQEEIIKALGDKEVSAILNDMSPDDRTALLEELPALVTKKLLGLLTPEERKVASELLGYPDKSIGRLMTPNYLAIKDNWTIEQVLVHVRNHGHDSETLNVLYAIDDKGHLIDDISMREILLASPETKVSFLMDRHFAHLRATDNQETAVQAFKRHGHTVLPVTETAGILVGIVTVDDVLDVAEEEATEDIQKLGGSEALDEPYLQISLARMIRKRSVWLVIIFFGEMLTATAMGFYEAELAQALILSFFIPLIISSGGNSGSQASTLVIRALALGEIHTRDWWKVMKREIGYGLAIGNLLGVFGFLRVTLWQYAFHTYGPHWILIGITIWVSLVGVVLWGTLAGSLLPFILKSLGVDPAASSAPFVATLVDVTGLVIYFNVALFILKGTLL